MRAIHMLLKDIRIYTRDWIALLINLVMPIALVGILGLSFSSSFAELGASISKFPVAVVDYDKGEMARKLVDDVLKKDLADIVDVEEVSEDEAVAAVKGETPAAIIIPEGFTKNINEGKATELRVIANPHLNISGGIVQQAVESYTVAISSITSATDAIMKMVSKEGIAVNPQEIAAQTAERLAGVQGKNVNAIAFSQQTGGKKTPTSMQYYAAAMLAMFSMFMAATGITSMLQERENYTLKRMYGAGIPKWEIMSTKLAGTWLSAFIEALILMAFTAYVFGVDWGDNIPAVLGVAAATVFAATGVAMIIAAITRTSKAAGGLAPAVINIMSAIGGSMFPIYAFSGFMLTASKGTINYWSLQGFLSLMSQDAISAIYLPIAVLAAIGVAGLAIGILTLRLD
ncbi:ABC transporter permease [Mahella sp.]|uniref:ABC transporter permease n=1 Tax=Mahella sp. TaxID=2798721 RepID=UPI0025BC2E8B|nr:ABC transporter permease [Mahella sp.]MBZ4665400.1 type transporter [Mahella sp.]